ncbi:MAG: MBOAT family protein, partial [Acetatifactor sp.]|nr:MBOAT family protein [Acetatifactor sp.]
MLFTSYAFLGFIAVLFLLYYLIPKRMQWGLLLIASYLFYFIAGPFWLLYLLTTTATTYFAAIQIEKTGLQQKAYIKANKEQLSGEERKAYKEKMKGRQRSWMLACLLLNLGILAVVKYTNFAISNINGLLRMTGSAASIDFWDIALPMGISFYTFQALGYLIDVYRGTAAAEKNPFRLALFVSFFPQLIQGPISRFGDLARSLYEEHVFEAKRFCYGLERILWGYFKKLVIADRILTAVNMIIRDAETYRGVYVFVG